jgi:DNA-directed RNA polymerase sigma subunit (sigma70/sigma32)
LKDRKKGKKAEKKLDTPEVKSIIAQSSEGELTLQQIGDIFDITRMRVCQIEKASLKKLASLDCLKSV